MTHESLQNLVKAKKWADLEREWLGAIEQLDADAARLLDVIDKVVQAGQGPLASTMGWAWLSVVKENHPPAQALQLGRGLLLRLPDGEELREEILSLYRQTHQDQPHLEGWIDRSGLKSGKSVRRALRFLEMGLRLAPGAYLVHRSEDETGQIVEIDADDDRVVVQTRQRKITITLARLIEEYDLAAENDFRVLSQFQPEKLAALVENDPASLAVGILRCHGNRLDRDVLKLMLVPRLLPAGKWSDWWSRLRGAVKRSPHLRIEGRSPMFLIYDAAGRSLESQTWAAFEIAETPRDWLELLENYLRDTKQLGVAPDTVFLDRVQARLVDRIARFAGHRDPMSAFATALVIDRVAADGLPVSTDAHGMALKMLGESPDPVAMVAALPDTRLWPLAVRCVEQAFTDRLADLLAELILYCPAGLCDALARKVEKAGKSFLLQAIVERATADPGEFTDAMMWVWKGPGVDTPLPSPPLLEMLNIILALVGPARVSQGRNVGQTTLEMRAKVRAGLAARDYRRFRECIRDLDPAMAQAVRRLLARADGLGPKVQEDMGNILREQFPDLYAKPKVRMWEDDSVLWFTQAGYDTKQAELEQLVNVKMRENARAIGEAAAHGDLSENSEYKFALEERDLLRARVAQYNRDISMARILAAHDVPSDTVSVGHRVRLRPTAGGEPVILTILGVGDSDLTKHVYSYQTPLVLNILGKKAGDTAVMSFDGHEAQYVIEHFESVVM